MPVINQPWAVILCKFNSDFTGKADVITEHATTPGVMPLKTACENFFTNKNAGYNAVRFFSDMSHGMVDISGSGVFGWYTINANITGYTAVGDPELDKSQGEIINLAKQAAINAGINLTHYFGVVVIMNVATGWAQGSPGQMAADWRRVDGRNMNGTIGVRSAGGGNGTEIFGQEMGHGWGLDHSRIDGSTDDYRDSFDIMSTLRAYSSSDNDYCAKGPGMNAWNMRSRGWLDESRVWHCPAGVFFKVLQLRPLQRIDLDGFLAAELPPLHSTGGFPSYLVEYRKKEGWDIGFPSSCVLVHRYEGQIGQQLGAHSYLMHGTNGRTNLVAGDSFSPSLFVGPQMHVIDIDDEKNIATIMVTIHNFIMPATFDPDWWIKTRGGLIAPGPGPWWHIIRHYFAGLNLFQTADEVHHDLKSSVMKLAIKQIEATLKEMKSEVKKISDKE